MFKTTLTSSIIFISLSSITYAEPYIGTSINLGAYGSRFGFQRVGASIFGGTGTKVGAKQNLYLGGELSLDYLHHTSRGASFIPGVSFIPGIMLTKNTMLYGRLGIEGTYSSGGYYDGHSYQRHCNFNFGTKLGLGIQTKFTQHLDFRTEYTSSSLQRNQLNFGLVYKFK